MWIGFRPAFEWIRPIADGQGPSMNPPPLVTIIELAKDYAPSGIWPRRPLKGWPDRPSRHRMIELWRLHLPCDPDRLLVRVGVPHGLKSPPAPSFSEMLDYVTAVLRQ
jgi:hypothetical protein